jgi:hypothetical protein
VTAVPRPVKGAVPRPGHDMVWSHEGVDHDPVPAHQVTVCGDVIPPPFIYDYANADNRPCPDCFEGEPR